VILSGLFVERDVHHQLTTERPQPAAQASQSSRLLRKNAGLSNVEV
jgi:hypothetical protein